MANFNYVEPKKVTSPRDYVRKIIPIKICHKHNIYKGYTKRLPLLTGR